ncbi:zinc finger protein 385B isoform X6 [Tachysurus fulvidraco]|uniref:zinc finger protein 385B isoform X6 n=1 Tax=Tachysurus fulvidraco TaxID=1234273 RepID=UPI001FEF5AA9|nr:zinc finger protein 385B isoform X6 [Tachysurus fulvidraco]
MLVMLGSVVEHTEERNLTGMKHFYSTIDELGALTEVTRFDTAPSEEADFTRHKAPPLNARLKSERKHRSYTVCEVCNIQLNSAAQAQIHYNGKTHQKRLRHMKSGNTGPAAQGSPLLAALPVQTRPLQTPLELKNFLPFRLNGSSPLSLFPNFNTMDPVQKAVINHTFGVPQKKKQVISCNICHLRFNSTNQAEAHYKGHKHARKLKALESQKNKQHRRQLDSTHSSRDRDREKDRDRDRDRGRMIAADPHPALLDSCAVEASRIKHKLMLEGQSVLPRRRGKALSSRAACKSKRLANKGSLGVSSKSFHCEVCEIHVNSETQLNQHMNSRRHKDRLAGKPPKPKFSPHSKTQPTTAVSQSIRWNGYAGGAMSAMKKVFNQYGLTSLSSQFGAAAFLTTKLALQKQLTKSLTTSFLPTAITPPTLCTVAANPLALRHPAAFIPAPILGPTLFRPAPGPLRATHTPILFSPY